MVESLCVVEISVDDGNDSNSDEEEWDCGDGDYDEQRVAVRLVVVLLPRRNKRNHEIK